MSMRIMGAVTAEKIERILMHDIMRDISDDIYKYEYIKSTLIKEYINKYHLVDMSKKYKDLDQEGNHYGSNPNIDFGNFGRYTYILLNDAVHIIELAAYKGRLLRKNSYLIRTDDGKFSTCRVNGFILSDLFSLECKFNAAFKYKDEAIKEGLKELETKYAFMEQLRDDALDSVEHRLWNNFKYLRVEGQLTDSDMNNIENSVKKRLKDYMEEKLFIFNYYLKEKEQNGSE